MAHSPVGVRPSGASWQKRSVSNRWGIASAAPPSAEKYSVRPPLRTRPGSQQKLRRRVSRPPLGTKRSQGVTVSVQGSPARFSTVYSTATVFWPWAMATRRVTRTPRTS